MNAATSTHAADTHTAAIQAMGRRVARNASSASNATGASLGILPPSDSTVTPEHDRRSRDSARFSSSMAVRTARRIATASFQRSFCSNASAPSSTWATHSATPGTSCRAGATCSCCARRIDWMTFGASCSTLPVSSV